MASRRAVVGGAPDVMELLFDQGVRSNSGSSLGYVSLWKASYFGKNKLIKCLRKRGVDVKISSYDMRIPSLFAEPILTRDPKQDGLGCMVWLRLGTTKLYGSFWTGMLSKPTQPTESLTLSICNEPKHDF